MGSYIHLTVGRWDLDWGKNWGFTDHSPLFQQSDLALIPYCCYEEHPIRDAMSKPLGQVIDRLELLGFTLAHCEREFDLQQRDDERIHQMIGYELEHCSFDELKRQLI
jgi:hypothetical protein